MDAEVGYFVTPRVRGFVIATGQITYESLANRRRESVYPLPERDDLGLRRDWLGSSLRARDRSGRRGRRAGARAANEKAARYSGSAER